MQEEPARGCRCFLLLNPGHAGNLDTAAGQAAAIRCGDVYAVTAGGPRPGCTCPGFAAGGRAGKHQIAVRELVATADLPRPLADAGADRATTEREDAPFEWPRFRRLEASPDRIEAAAEFLRRLA